jgi:hypothetical protein
VAPQSPSSKPRIMPVDYGRGRAPLKVVKGQGCRCDLATVFVICGNLDI